MIGVIADSSERTVISEFFELFKTPWEFYRNDRVYDVLLCAGDAGFKEITAKLTLMYASQKLTSDGDERVESASPRSHRMLSYKGTRIPIYGDSITFREKEASVLVDEESGRPVIYRHSTRGGEVARIGYDLFAEVQTLLTVGQTKINAGIPTLDLHIALLRDLIVASGVSLVEIPPVPDGFRFIACLTHDVDHPSICRHKWDHTMFGFLYRAGFTSLVNVLRRRISLRNLLTNWAAALKLPFVYMGFARDFWCGFEDRYLELEKGLCSTFFVIPFKNYPGRNSQGPVPAFRAARYGANDIADTLKKLIAAGCEVGLHGIDAWLDSSTGREEFEEIRRLTGVSEIGVRMHWLYYDQQSPVALELAEAVYDSTIGYRETVGYRAGTTQAYRPLQVNRLLELPLHVMDTALFYPDYLGLSPREAAALLGRMVDNAAQFGGCLTINWHDRSLAPERLWYACYRDLVQDLKNRCPWFATAGQAVSWFKKRRSVVFETESLQAGEVFARIVAKDRDNLPGLRLRIHRPSESGSACASESYVDLAFNDSVDNRVFCGVGA
jgi:hypothetical protein